MPFNDNVLTQCTFDNLDEQVRNKINEIAQDGGRGSHGQVMLTDLTRCDHWRAGDYRIFGSWNQTTGNLTVIGWGEHTGRGDSSYKVQLCAGGTTKAQTS